MANLFYIEAMSAYDATLKNSIMLGRVVGLWWQMLFMTVCMVIKLRFGKRIVVMNGGRWRVCTSACTRTIWLSSNVLCPLILV